MIIGDEAHNRLKALAGLFRRSRQEWYELAGNHALWIPADGSHAAWEREYIETHESGPSGPWTAADAQLPLHVAGLYGLAAAEIVGGLAPLYEAGEVVFSAGPLVRSVVEHSSRAVLLIDNEISPRRRVARAWMELLESGRQAKKTAAAFGVAGSHERASAYDELRAKARSSFYPGEVDETGASVKAIAGETLLSQARVLRRVETIVGKPRSVGTLDYLANVSHPTAYAIRELLTEVTDDHGNVTLRAALVGTAYPERLAGLALISLYDVARVVGSFLDWPPHQLDDWYDAIGTLLPESAPPASQGPAVGTAVLA